MASDVIGALFIGFVFGWILVLYPTKMTMKKFWLLVLFIILFDLGGFLFVNPQNLVVIGLGQILGIILHTSLKNSIEQKRRFK